MLGKTTTNRLLGVLFIGLLVGGVMMTYAVFTKAFTDYEEVTLQASKIGLQLPDRADIKIRGDIVGEVIDVQTRAEGAEITLGLYPEKTEAIPRNVTAALVPKTLFGEKYVALELPEDPSPEPIQEGDRIEQTDLPIEIEEVLRDMYPLLRAVDPAQINFTLTAIANALEGRGEKLGASLETLDDYLTELNKDVPAIVEDLRLLGETSDVYASIAPQLAQLFRNSVTSTNTVQAKRAALKKLFTEVAAFSDTTRQFLDANGDNMTRLSELGARQAALYRKYSPIYPCFLTSISTWSRTHVGNWRNQMLHINLETLERQPRPYDVSDRPVYGEKSGPLPESYCRNSLAGKYNQRNLPPPALVPDMRDGVDEPLGKRAATGFGSGGSDLGLLLGARSE